MVLSEFMAVIYTESAEHPLKYLNLLFDIRLYIVHIDKLDGLLSIYYKKFCTSN